MSILSTITAFLGFDSQSVSSQIVKKDKISYESQLKTFEMLGFTINNGINISEVWKKENLLTL